MGSAMASVPPFLQPCPSATTAARLPLHQRQRRISWTDFPYIPLQLSNGLAQYCKQEPKDDVGRPPSSQVRNVQMDRDAHLEAPPPVAVSPLSGGPTPSFQRELFMLQLALAGRPCALFALPLVSAAELAASLCESACREAHQAFSAICTTVHVRNLSPGCQPKHQQATYNNAQGANAAFLEGLDGSATCLQAQTDTHSGSTSMAC